jgi:Reverse transcriptase (RNA-dependent DNA polymerase)
VWESKSTSLKLSILYSPIALNTLKMIITIPIMIFLNITTFIMI